MTSLPICIVIIEILTCRLSAFLVDEQKCVAYTPCRCSGNQVYCNQRGLTTLPKFKVSNIFEKEFYLKFYSNQLTSIPPNAFVNLTVSNITLIHMSFLLNRIDSISQNAFTGIADNIYDLDLQANNLSHIPPVLKSLHNLNHLNLYDNPIKSILQSYDILYSLRYSLRTLYIDLNGFSSWPTELNVLSSLQGLHVRFLNMTHLDFNVFDKFKNTLIFLDISYSELERIPVAVCHLQHLQTLHFRYNSNANSKQTIFEPCQNKLNSLTYLILSGNNLTHIPHGILQGSPLLDHLYLDSNLLAYIRWDAVPDNYSLTFLSLNFNFLTRIPSVINKMQNLKTFTLWVNKIVSIEDSDLRNMFHLQRLELYGNPLEYISPDAFKFTNALINLDLRNTKLVHLPVSLAGLTNLKTMYIQGTEIECSCDLSFLKVLNISKIDINGNCKLYPTEIKTYLIDDLPRCPWNV